MHRIDRLGRDLAILETLIARLAAIGVSVRSVTEPDVDTNTDDPTKILIRQILGALAAYERALIRGRMEAGRAIKAARGGYVGGQPRYGTRATDGALVQDHDESELIAFIQELRSQGRSYRAIGRQLEGAGYQPRRARRWHPTVVRAISQRATRARERDTAE